MPVILPPSPGDSTVTVAYELEDMPRIEKGLRRLILDRITGIPDLKVVTSLPSPMPLRVVRLARVAGPRERLNDFPVVDIESFSPTYAEASRLAERIDTLLMGYPLRAGDVVLDTVYATVAPVELPWEDANVRRFLATYRFSVRR